MITADELAALIAAEKDLSQHPPVSDPALDGAAAIALRTWGNGYAPAHLSPAA